MNWLFGTLATVALLLWLAYIILILSYIAAQDDGKDPDDD